MMGDGEYARLRLLRLGDRLALMRREPRDIFRPRPAAAHFMPHSWLHFERGAP